MYKSLLILFATSAASVSSQETFFGPSLIDVNTFYSVDDQITAAVWFWILVIAIIVLSIIGCVYCCCYLPAKRQREANQMLLMNMQMNKNNSAYGQPTIIMPVPN